MPTLNWKTCSQGWCSFERLITDNLDYDGIYMIFYQGRPGRVVRLGQGNIRERILRHRNDAEVMRYSGRGLYATWAAVDRQYLDGIERYLADKWNPLVGDVFPDVRPIAVNSPF